MASPTLPKPRASDDLGELARPAPELRLVLGGERVAVDGVHWASRAAHGRVAYGDLALTRTSDRSTARLWQLVADGAHIGPAALELADAGAPAPCATYAFADLAPLAFSTEGTADAQRDELQLGLGTSGAPALTVAPSAPAIAGAVVGDPSAPATAAEVVGELAVDGLPGPIAIARHAWHVSAGSRPGAFTVAKPVDAASPALLAAFATGEPIARVEIALAHTTYLLIDAVISTYALVGDRRPLERLGFDAARIAAR